jgi:magnesium transporter
LRSKQGEIAHLGAKSMQQDPDFIQATDLQDAWPFLDLEERLEGFRLLSSDEAERFFGSLQAREICDILAAIPASERQRWMRVLEPDDAADVVQAAASDQREALLGSLDPLARREVAALLAYAEDDAGGLMSPRYVRLRPEMTVDEAIAYLRRAARERVETIYYIYVLDADNRLLGVISFRELFGAPPQKLVREVMRTRIITVRDDLDQEEVANVIAENDLMAVPVVNAQGQLQGIVTIDDVVDVVREEATEDIQKIGGSAALDAPYLETTIPGLVRKRAVWLSVLFVGEMFTASALGYFEHEIQRAVVLALFIPLIISSGGNAGSQATTLVIRAMAMEEVRMRDWWRVFRRELAAGAMLGAILGLLGLLRIVIWPTRNTLYGEHWPLIGAAVALSVVGVVLWGALVGSMLPFVLRRAGLDPATASAPFVATLVDVTGLVIYFSVATVVLSGTLL